MNEKDYCQRARSALFAQTDLSAEHLAHLASCPRCANRVNALGTDLEGLRLRYVERAAEPLKWIIKPGTLPFKIAACITLVAFGGGAVGAPLYSLYHEALRKHQAQRLALGLDKPVWFVTDSAERPSEIHERARPLMIIGDEAVIQGRARPALRDVTLSVTPGLGPRPDEPFIETRPLVPDASETAPFEFALRLPKDERLRTVTLEFKPTAEAVQAAPEDLRPERLTYTVHVACRTAGPIAYVEGEWGGSVTVKRSGRWAYVTLRSSTPVGSFVTLAHKGIKSDKWLCFEPKAVSMLGEEFTFNVQLGLDPIEVRAYAIKEGTADQLVRAIETGDLTGVLPGDRLVLRPSEGQTGDSGNAQPADRETRLPSDGESAAEPLARFVSVPATVESHVCEVEIERSGQGSREDWFGVIPASAPESCWIQASVVRAPRESRVVYLGMKPPLQTAERFTIVLLSAPPGVVAEGEMRVADFDKASIRIEDSRVVTRLK